ncbi:MAG: hypothetical protein QNJ68_00645 [Microcoleaceae cyanobacterium MO_207.B10]|nr:hypothetical protein [Microcoleaceae cyanobacterium MO_207.B10]
MSRSLFAGLTDYSYQTLSDMLQDLEEWIVSLRKTHDFFDKTINQLTQNGYWNKTVPLELNILFALKS